MPTVTRTIGGLFNGVSQQSPVMRQDGQCELQENMEGTVTYGLEKRRGTQWLAQLNSSTADKNTLEHEFEDSEGNQYITLFTGDATDPIEVYKLDGTPCNVTYEGNALNYVNSLTEPYKNLSICSIADYTIVANNTVECAMTADRTDARTYVALVWVKKGVIRTKYTIKATGTSDTHTTSDTQTSTEAIAGSLTGLSGFTSVTQLGSVIRLEGTQAMIDSVTVEDGYGNQGLVLVKGKATKITDLPPQAGDGDLVEITGKKEDSYSSYWVKYDKAENEWEESVGADCAYRFDPDTMPHQLIRTDETEFLFRPSTIDEVNGYSGWEDRYVGDDEMSPLPSFIGSKISDVFFSKGRLSFLSGQNIIRSVSNDFFNFFPETTTEVLDSDPDDKTVGVRGVARLKHGVAYNEDLLVLSDKAQFIGSTGGDIDSPNSMIYDQTTTYPASEVCPPVVVGSDVYFVSNSGDYSTVRQFFVQSDSLINDAVDLTAHVPKYVPKNIKRIVSIPNYDALAMLSVDEPNALYIYKWYTAGNQKPQSAWYKYTLDVDEIVSYMVFDSELYLIVLKDGEYHLEMYDPREVNAWRLDRFHINATGTYDAGNNKSIFTLPYSDSNTDDWVVIIKDINGFYTHGANVTKESATSISVVDDFITNAETIWIGKQFESRYRFNRWFLKDTDTRGFQTGSSVGNIQGSLELNQLTLSYNETGYYRLEWYDEDDLNTPNEFEEFTGVTIGGTVMGEPPLQTDMLASVLGENAHDIWVDLVNDTYLPMNINATAFEGEWSAP